VFAQELSRNEPEDREEQGRGNPIGILVI